MQEIIYPAIDLIKTGENIKYLRKQHNMSVKEMQEIFGFTSPQAIYKWQWGDTLPDIQNLLLMASIWKVPIESILVLKE